MKILPTLFFLLATAPAMSPAAEWGGPVVGVHDGDTLTVMNAGKGVKIRLTQIDAPELGQSYGAASKLSLSSLCYGKDAEVRDEGTDKYGRTLGRVMCAGVDVNAEQVKRGMAWFYTQYGNDKSLKAAEEHAKKAGAGLWADGSAIPPWEYRHPERRGQKLSGGNAAGMAPAQPVGGCGSKTTCGQMASCEEAKHYLNDCGVGRLDKDRDGIPCEAICQ